MTLELDLLPTDLHINRDHPLIKEYLPTKFEASGEKNSWVISYRRCRRPINKIFDFDLWPTDLNIKDRQLIKDYPPTKFEASETKRSWFISCTRLRDTDIPTYRPTDMCSAIYPSFFEGGIIRNHEQYKYKTKSTPTQITLLQDLRSGPYCLWQNNKYTIIMSQIR